MQSEPNWGSYGEIAWRTLLVRKLSQAQRQEFNSVFDIFDSQKWGKFTLLEMRKFMDSARLSNKSNEELLGMMAPAAVVVAPEASSSSDSTSSSLSSSSSSLSPQLEVMSNNIGRDEFLGVMAEAEFYNLFTETFQELDKQNTGYCSPELEVMTNNIGQDEFLESWRKLNFTIFLQKPFKSWTNKIRVMPGREIWMI